MGRSGVQGRFLLINVALVGVLSSKVQGETCAATGISPLVAGDYIYTDHNHCRVNMLDR